MLTTMARRRPADAPPPGAVGQEWREKTMRTSLAPLCWRRHQFVATVGPRGSSPDGPTICFRALADADTGAALVEHVWCRLKGYNPPALAFGARIAFRATVRPYRRGDGSHDYHLCGLRNVIPVGERTRR